MKYFFTFSLLFLTTSTFANNNGNKICDAPPEKWSTCFLLQNDSSSSTNIPPTIHPPIKPENPPSRQLMEIDKKYVYKSQNLNMHLQYSIKNKVSDVNKKNDLIELKEIKNLK